MARKKQEEQKKGAPEWQTTFSDLMNLLLCFFVLLFSMSSVDANKWEQIVASLAGSFSIMSGGETSIGDGMLVGMGTSQLTDLDEYYNTMGKRDEDTEGEKIEEKKGADDQEKEQEKKQDSKEDKDLKEQLQEANVEETKEILDNISEKTEEYNLMDYLDIKMDSSGKYVELTLSGSVLFDSGSAELMESSLPVFSKVGDILSLYKDHNIDIIGHTDNVPMHSDRYESNDILSSARAISAAEYLVSAKGLSIEKLSWTGRGEYEPVASNATAEGRAQNRRIEIRIYNTLSSE